MLNALRIRRFGFSRAALVAPLLVACAPATDGDISEGSESDLVVGLPDLSDNVAVFDDRLELDARVESKLVSSHVLEKIEAYARAADKKQVEPVFFIGGRQKDALGADGAIKEGVRNPMGYLRRALSWEKGRAGTIVVKTAHADMAETVEELKKTGYLELATSSISPLDSNGVDTDSGFGNTDKTWSIPIGPDGDVVPIDLSGKTLWEKQVISGGKARLTLKQGKITLRPTADVHVLVERFVPRSAEATITTDIRGVLEFEASADGAFDDVREGTLYKKSWGKEVRGLPLSMDIEVRYACEVASTGQSVATAGTTAKGTVRAGASIEGTHLTGILDRPTFDGMERLGPQLDSKVDVQGICHLTSTLDLHVFDSSGPRASVDLYARLSADGTNAQLGAQANATLLGGVDANVSGSLEPFGFKLADISAPPYHFEKQLYSGQIRVGQGGGR